MTVIDHFLDTVRSWHGPDGLLLDDDAVSAPHESVRAFDLDAFAGHAHGLRTGVRLLDGVLGDLDGAADAARTGWDGAGGTGLAQATGRLAGEVTGLRDALDGHARSVTLAHSILETVLAEYRLAMTEAGAPLDGVDPGDVRAEITARLDLADAAGRAASRAVDEGIAVLHDEWRTAVEPSDGELVMTGER